MLAVTRRLTPSPGAVWEALTDVRCWPDWGPTVGAARIDRGGHKIKAGTTGRVRTPLGVWLPFRVTQFEDGHRWAWSVASVPATAHRVEARPGGGASVTIEVPLWVAGAYAPVCWLAIGRLGRVATRLEGGLG